MIRGNLELRRVRTVKRGDDLTVIDFGFLR